jgi:hypothetical protein
MWARFARRVLTASNHSGYGATLRILAGITQERTSLRRNGAVCDLGKPLATAQRNQATRQERRVAAIARIRSLTDPILAIIIDHSEWFRFKRGRDS